MELPSENERSDRRLQKHLYAGHNIRKIVRYIPQSGLPEETPPLDDPEAARRLCDAAEETHIFSNPYAKKRYLYAE